MSMVPPTVNPIKVPESLVTYRPVTDIVPFTYRAGITYQELLECLRVYTTGYLTHYLTDEFGEFADSWESNVTTVIDAVNTALTDQREEVAANLAATLAQIVAGANLDLNNGLILASLQEANSTALAYLDSRYELKATAFGFFILNGTGIDLTGATVSTAAVQAFFDALPDGSAVVVPARSVISLDGQVKLNHRVRLSGSGELRWTAGIASKEALSVYGNGTVIDGVRMTTSVAPAASGDKQFGIAISAQHVVVQDSYLDGFQQAIAVQPTGEYYGAKILTNTVLNVPGSGLGAAGDGTNTTPTGEDRGDGIVVWGAGAIVTGNTVVLKNGTDGRIGIHSEGIPSYEGTPGPHSSSMNKIIGNTVTGKFRRGIAIEGILGAVVQGNTVADATWWGIGLTGADGSVCIGNTIIWTRTTSEIQGSAFAPKRCGIEIYGGGARTVVADNVITVMVGAALTFGIHGETNGVGTRDSLDIHDNLIMDDQYSMFAAIYLSGAGGVMTQVNIHDNICKGFNSFGIFTANSEDPIVSRNRITGQLNGTAVGINIEGNASGARADNNNIKYTGTAIKLNTRTASTTAQANLIESATYGIDFTGTPSIAADINRMISVTNPTKS